MPHIRAAGIIIQDDKILLIHRKKDGSEYYVFPGGGVEQDETIEQAVLREVAEETSIQVAVDRPLYHHVYDNDSEQWFYYCTYISGILALGDSNELRAMQSGENTFYEPVWVSLDTLSSLLVYPVEVRNWLIEYIKNGFSDEVRHETLRLNDLQQTL